MSKEISVLISEEEIDRKIREIGARISKDYEGKVVHFVCVLRGSVFFATELAKRLTIPVTIDFMSVSSYGNSTKSSGVIKIIKDLDDPLEGKNVIVIEDIIDTGNTLEYLLKNLKLRHPESIALCTLLDKPERRVADVKVDYTCFEVPDKFIVGYGLDWAQKYRNLPYIGVVETEE
ncbi:MAG: hypoxanthine phosphoribosyltransferase [Lachnospiraceae bacterium]|nr:hypoxanthine phosphoribosyltransferase [Lachnospiraceae bacterium]